MTEQCKKGFTLVELLIVSGIISLLMAIIIPVLGRARDKFNMITCRSNQRNLLMGCLLYADVNNSQLPVDKQLSNPHKKLIRCLYENNYTSEIEVYYCPSEKKDHLKFSQKNFSAGNIGYFYYSFSERPTYRYLSAFFLKKLPWPRLLNTTMKPQTWVFSDSWFSGIPTAHRWYKKAVNYITLDGSAHMLKASPKSEFK